MEGTRNARGTLAALGRSPVVAVTGVLAVALTLSWWMGSDISHAFASPLVGRGQVWRLVTSVFPHKDVLHLGFNLYWLVLLGLPVERAFGSLRTLGIFLLLAATSSAWQMALDTGGVGLSGVGYGLFGMLWVLGRSDPRFRGTMDAGTVNLFLGWFMLCCVLTAVGAWHVGNVAHGSGAVAGALVGLAVTGNPGRRRAWSLVAFLLLGTGLTGATALRPWICLSSSRGAEEARLGYEALVSGSDTDAELWLRQAVALAPREASHRYNLGVALQRQRRLREALDAFREATRLDPANAEFAKTAREFEAWLAGEGR